MIYKFVLLHLLPYIASQNFPDYWRGKVSTDVNGTMTSPAPIKITSSEKVYNKKGSKADNKIKSVTNSVGNTIPSELYYPSNVPPVNKSGAIHKVKLEKGFLTYLEVLDEFNFDNTKSVPVKICTSWYDWNKLQSFNHTPGLLSDGVRTGHILNISMFVQWMPLSSASSIVLNKDRTWEIEEYLCYYQGSSAKLSNGKCVIPYTEIIDHYSRLWDPFSLSPRSVNGKRVQVTNDEEYKNFPCGKPEESEEEEEQEEQEEIDCPDKNETINLVPETESILDPDFKWYLFDTEPAGFGYAVNTTFGYNHTRHIYDVNFTILFNNWTYDLPEGLLNNYRDLSFLYDKFGMEIYYWVEDPPEKEERSIPSAFFIILLAMGAPAAVLVLATATLALTCSKKVFFLPVWDQWVKEKAKEKITKEEARKLKREKAIEKSKQEQEKKILKLIEEKGLDLKQDLNQEEYQEYQMTKIEGGTQLYLT